MGTQRDSAVLHIQTGIRERGYSSVGATKSTVSLVGGPGRCQRSGKFVSLRVA